MRLISQFFSDDGRRRADVTQLGGGRYYLEYFYDGKPHHTQDYLSGDWPLNEVEDLAEDFCIKELI